MVVVVVVVVVVVAVPVDFIVVVVVFVFVVSFVVVSHFSVKKHQKCSTSVRCMSVYDIG